MARTKVLGVDLGRRYVGFAYGFMDMSVAFPFAVDQITDLHVEDACKLILRHLQEVAATRVVLGKSAYGSDARFESFRDEVVSHLQAQDVLVELCDEHVSTIEAENRIEEFNLKDWKGRKDAIAAQIILERYLEKNKS